MSEQSATLLDRSFALIIAFVLPGLIALFGIATVNPTVLAWFTGAAAGPTLVGLFFVLFAALALSLVISALRWYLFEQLAWLPGCPIVKAPPRFNQAKRVTCEAQFIDIRHQHYYYYLAHSHTALAIPIAVMAWMSGHWMTTPKPTAVMVVVLTVLGTVILARAACNAIVRHDERTLSLLGLEPDPAVTSSGPSGDPVAAPLARSSGPASPTP